MGPDLRETILAVLKESLVVPPLRNQPIQEDHPAVSASAASEAAALETTTTPASRRTRRKSKFTAEQDRQIIELKKKGRSWVDIAKITGIGSFLAARNRYQVLMGQQGAASAVWGYQDKKALQNLMDEGEMEKWRFIAREMYKLTGKFFTEVQCRELIRELFLADPGDFGVDGEILKDLEGSDDSRSDISSQQLNPSYPTNGMMGP
jgi:hypothetical protein